MSLLVNALSLSCNIPHEQLSSFRACKHGCFPCHSATQKDRSLALNRSARLIICSKTSFDFLFWVLSPDILLCLQSKLKTLRATKLETLRTMKHELERCLIQSANKEIVWRPIMATQNKFTEYLKKKTELGIDNGVSSFWLLLSGSHICCFPHVFMSFVYSCIYFYLRKYKKIYKIFIAMFAKVCRKVKVRT